MKQSFEIHGITVAGKEIVVYSKAKSMISALKKIKGYHGLEHFKVLLIKLIDDSYARVRITYNSNAKCWYGRAYYRGINLTQSVESFPAYDEDADCTQACNAFIKLVMKEFDITEHDVMIVTHNTGTMVKIGFA